MHCDAKGAWGIPFMVSHGQGNDLVMSTSSLSNIK